MNRVEECMGQDPKILRGRILARLRLVKAVIDFCPGTWRLDGLSSWNPEARWTFVLEPGGWMDFRVMLSSAPVSKLLLIVCDIALCPRRRVSHSTSLRLGSIDINSPKKGPWTFVSGPEAVYNPKMSCGNSKVLLSILRSYLDQEVMWESGGSSLDPEILFGTRRLSKDPKVVSGALPRPGGRIRTWRSFGNPEVPSDPEVVFKTQRSFGNPEVPSDPEVVFRTQMSFVNPEVPSDPEVVFRTRRSFGNPEFREDFRLHFWRLSSSMNRVEECMGQDPKILRGRILARLRIRGMRRFNKTRRPKLRILMLDGLSSWNPEARWTFVLEPGGWMDSRPGTRRLDGLSSWNPEAVG
ncbi:hypothetical protein F2Q69_00043066 [Brassica cretica]|uniref:Uncharacterized protein n=1 Tax=Brassica cretica TaxID=69181 RepID=A0A8S9NR77_BRACR|nr:hypothetical protein F2Q69_00043066 [Brassica cretica]